MKLQLHEACRLITAHPCGMIAIEKGAGVLSHPNRQEDQPMALMNAPYDIETEAYQLTDGPCYLLNRLDAPTSGVILLSNNADCARVAREAFARHDVEKEYVALVKGVPPRREEHWRDRLKVVRKRGSLRAVVLLGTANAFCDMRLLDRGSGPPARALLSLRPATGRTHQLRVQCARRRLPIIGDSTYGDFAFNRAFRQHSGDNRLFLHSHRTRLKIRLSGKEVKFAAESPIPEAFAVALR